MLNERVPFVGLLPEVAEAVADITVGFLAVVLFAPIVYGLSQILAAGEGVDEGLYVLIFWNSWQELLVARDVSWVVVVVGLILVSFLIGFLMRHPFWLVMTIIVKLCKFQKLIAFPAFKTLQWEYGGEKWTKAGNWKTIKKNFVNKLPFWQVGDENYARFRGDLMKSGGELGGSRAYWQHEEFLFFLHNRAFSVVVTFVLTYSLYAIFVAWSLKSFWPPYIPFWLALGLAIFIAFSLYRGMLFHGCAFIAIHNVLYKEFKKAVKSSDNTK